MKKIVFLDEYSVDGGDLSAIKALGDYTGYYDTRPDLIVERAKDAEILMVNKINITDAIMEELPSLKLICIAATGINNIDLESAGRRGIIVKNVKGYSTSSVAEKTLSGALAMLRETVYYDEYVKERYASSPRPFNFDRPTFQLAGRNWGIVGLGAIGHEVARLAAAFGCDIAYTSTSGVKREEKYPEMELRELLAWADVVSVHAPLNERTNNLIGQKELAAMKPSAIIINVARGGIVNERALADAIDGGVISGAVMDVFTKEPIDTDNPLLGVRDKYRLILSPHNAWSDDVAIKNLIAALTENIREYVEKGV